MKKLIYISGIICILLILIGSLLKVQHWPGANVMLILGLGSFCFWFLPAALINNYRNADMKHWKSVYIVTFITFFIDTLGALFKIMHWPGAGWLLIVGITLPFLLFLPVFVYKSSKEKNFPMINFMGVMFGLTFLGIFTTLLALNVAKTVLNYGLMSAYNNIGAYNYYPNTNSEDTENQMRADEIYEFIDDLNNKLLVSRENIERFESNKAYELLNIDMLNDESATGRILHEVDNGTQPLAKLKTMLSEYRKSLMKLKFDDESLYELIENLLDTESDLIRPSLDSWEYKEGFKLSYMQLTLANLTRIKENVRLLEHEVQAEMHLKKLRSF